MYLWRRGRLDHRKASQHPRVPVDNPEERVGDFPNLYFMHTSDAGPGRDASTVQVDLAGLSRLAGQLRALARDVAERSSLTDALSDPDLAGALTRAEDDWQTQRSRLRGFLDGAAQALDSSLAAYLDVDAAVAAALGSCLLYTSPSPRD